LVKPTVIICPKGVQCNLICISRNYTLFSMIFRLSRHFLRILLNQKEKKKRNPALGRGSGPRPQCRGVAWVGELLWGLGATAWRPIERSGPAVAVAHGARARRARVRRGAVTAAEAGAVAWAASACRWLPCCGVEGKGTRVVGGVRRAR
jgi:hypothetical protein